MRTRAILAGLALAAGSALFAAPAAQAAPTNNAQFCKSSGIIGPFMSASFFANQGGCASSLAKGPLVESPFGPAPSVISHAGYVSRCKQFVSELGLSYPFTTPDMEFVNIGNLNQCADRLQQLHDGEMGG